MPTNLITALVLSTGDQSTSVFERFKTVTIADSSPMDVAVSVINSTQQLVNGSICQISSLEVYRGRDDTTEISNGGLSLSENGTVEVK